MKVKDIMLTNPVVVHKETSVQETAKLLIENGVAALPVVEDGKLVGIISEGDLLYKKVRPHAPHYVNVLGASIYYSGMGEYNEQFKKLLATSVEELMTTEVITGKVTDDVEELTAVMIEQHLKVVPVLDGETLVGIFSRHDVVKLIAYEGETAEA